MPELEELTAPTAAAEAAAAVPAPEGITELLQKIQADTAAQKLYAKKRLNLARVCTAVLVVLLAVVLLAAGALAPRVNAIFVQTDAVLANLEAVSQTLAGIDYNALVSNINHLITQSETGVTQALTDMQRALSVLEQVDIAKLNQSITDLSSVISPIAKMFGGK